MAKLGDIVGHFNSLSLRLDQVWDKGKLSRDYKGLLKLLYDFTQFEGFNGAKSLPELIVDEFDIEQLWQELELQNSSFLPKIIGKAAKLLVNRDVSEIPIEMEGRHSFTRPSEFPKRLPLPPAAGIPDPVDLDDDLVSSDEEDDDDDGIGQANEDEEEIDFFADQDGDSKDSEIMYDQFFTAPDDIQSSQNGMEGEKLVENEDYDPETLYDDDQNENQLDEDVPEELLDESDEGVHEGPGEGSTNKKVTFKMSDTDSESEEEMSSFQKRQMRLQNKIDRMQEKALAQKSWQLSGEVAADSRPANSLLEEVVEFETTQRPAPVITEAVTDKLEDIIRKRIKDKAYDDVELKVKPVSTPAELKKKIVLNQEKSKQSLSEIYESEYLKQKQSTSSEQVEQELENPEHVELNKRLSSLFKQLDSLSDMYFIARPQEPELKLVSNTPAATAEDVGPTLQSYVAALAPEEAAPGFKKELISKEEKTVTDKKRERRKKKDRQALRHKWKAAFCDRPLPAQYSHEMNALRAKTLPTLSDRITKATSKEFFEKLQLVQSNPIASLKKPRKSESSHSAKRLKL